MKQLRVWDGDVLRICLLVSEGRQYAHLLHVPTLAHIKLPLQELARQLRSGIAGEVPISRGLVARIEASRRKLDRCNEGKGHRYPEAFVKEALAAIREDRAARITPSMEKEDGTKLSA